MKRFIGFAMIALTLGLFSCNNEDNISGTEINGEVTEKSAQISVAEVQAEAAATESDYEVEFYANAEPFLTRWWKMGKLFSWHNNLRYFENHCPDVEIEELENDSTIITLTYDSTMLNNGKVLDGIIVIVTSGHKSSQDYSRSVNYENFSVDSLLISGYSEIVVDKLDSTFRKFESLLTLTFPDGTIVSRQADRIWQWVEGLETQNDQSDDVVSITGLVTATITWPDDTSETYTKEITTPLKRMATCRYMVEGVVVVSIGDEVISTMDYGYSESDDECDKYAYLTTSNGEEVIDLSERNYKSKKEINQNGNSKKSNQNGNGGNNSNSAGGGQNGNG